MTDKPAAVSATEASILLGCSRGTITRLIEDGSLTAYRLTLAKNSSFRITKESLERFKVARQITT